MRDRHIANQDVLENRLCDTIIAQEIVEDLQAALAQFAEIAADLKK